MLGTYISTVHTKACVLGTYISTVPAVVSSPGPREPLMARGA